MKQIAENHERLLARIAAAAARGGRRPDEIQLVAISKTVTVEHVRAAYSAGLRCFGENRAQELRNKAAALADLPIEWHFVGHLQSNKVRYVTPNCALIHSVDSIDLARKINARGSSTQPQRILVQVNTTAEGTKSGVTLETLPALLDEIAGLPNLITDGLMTIGPLTDNATRIEAAFQALRQALEQQQVVARPRMPLKHLSMGMSGDFELAIEQGATLVRVGTAIFGPRDPASTR